MASGSRVKVRKTCLMKRVTVKSQVQSWQLGLITPGDHNLFIISSLSFGGQNQNPSQPFHAYKITAHGKEYPLEALVKVS